MNAQSKVGGIVLSVGFGIVLIAAPSQASKLHVENWGVDSSCGPAAAPCRSIAHALSFAVSGDKILVGPGRYSNDLDGDSTYDEPGEESSGGITLGSGVTVMSTHGSAATEIEYRGGFGGVAVVTLGTGAVFGKKNHGFHVVFLIPFSGAFRVVDGLLGGPSTVSGNVISVGSSGIDGIVGDTVRDNRVYGGGISSNSAAAIVERNVVSGAGIGFYGAGAFRRNVALHNTIGFQVYGSIVTAFTKNIAVANSGHGVEVIMGPITGPFQKNTIDGNDVSTNCGLYNNSGGALTATKNFWGAATGPGANPADGVCNVGASTTTTTPFLTRPVAPGPGAIQ
jgi:hypothetical protein